MKERPILFSGEMVRAILEGRKTQTRRLVKPARGLQSTWATIDGLTKCPSCYLCEVEGNLGAQFQHPLAGTMQEYGKVSADSPFGWFKCEYGKPSDQLWVRETWAPYHESTWPYKPGWIAFAADNSIRKMECGQVLHSQPLGVSLAHRWKPSIHMPRWVSRINLEITNVRVERLQDISEEDAIAEGVAQPIISDVPGTYKAGFAFLWEKINGSGSWEKNPWVWVIEFKLLGNNNRKN